MKKYFLVVLLVAGSFALQGCEKSHEELARDPANCEQMKDIPEAYERCIEDMKAAAR